MAACRCVQVFLKRASDRDGVVQVAFDRRLLAEPTEEAEKGAARIGVGGPAAGVLDEVVQPGGGDRLEQFLLGRKVAVHRARADPGEGRDLVEVVITEITHHGQSRVTGQPYRLTALGVIRVRDGQIVHYDDYMAPLALARLLGRTGELAAALSAS